VKDDRVLIDTSVWIGYFKGGDHQLAKKVDEVLSTADIYVPRVVIAELIQGAKSEKEISIIEEFVEAFNIVDQTEDTWLKAGRLSFFMKKKGLTVNIVDCYIAIIASENRCKIFSLDEHFRGIKRFLKLELFV